jgi:hypothetical protein
MRLPWIKTQDLVGFAYLEIALRNPGQPEGSSRPLSRRGIAPRAGASEWADYEMRYDLKPGERPEAFQIRLAFDGTGMVQFKEMELIKKSPHQTTSE